MARRSDHTPEQLKALAIGKALEIIDKKGPTGFSARGVAAAMGYTVGTLYHVFGDLDGLMLHVNARILDEWHEDLLSGLKKNKKPPLQYLALGYVDFARRRHNRWLTLFEFRAAKPGRLPAWYAEKMARLFGLVEDALRAQTGDGGKNPRQAAKVLWASIHGICVLSLSGKLDIVGAEKPEALAGALLETYIKGMAST